MLQILNVKQSKTFTLGYQLTPLIIVETEKVRTKYKTYFDILLIYDIKKFNIKVYESPYLFSNPSNGVDFGPFLFYSFRDIHPCLFSFLFHQLFHLTLQNIAGGQRVLINTSLSIRTLPKPKFLIFFLI